MKNIDEQTCLHTVCAYKPSDETTTDTRLITYLFEKFDKNLLLKSTDYKMNTPLHLACEADNLDIVQVLLNYDSTDVNFRNLGGQTAFQICCENGYLDIIEIIFKFKPLGNSILLNCDENHGDLPIQIACKKGNLKLLKYLIANGADPLIKDEKNRNILDISIDKKRKEIIQYLLKFHFGLLRIGKHDNGQLVKLCDEMPDMAKLVLDRAVLKNKKFDLKYLDPPFEDLENNRKQHPLYIIANSKKDELLKHEAIIELLNFKWRRYPRFIYYANLIFYLLFVILLTIQIIVGRNSIDNNQKLRRIEVDNNTSVLETNLLKFKSYTEYHTTKHLMLTYSLYIVFFFHIIKEFVQLGFSKVRYFYEMDNCLEFLTCILAIIYLLPISTDTRIVNGSKIVIETVPNYKNDFQWQAGSICVLCAWFSLGLYIDKLPYIGIYAVMFRRVTFKSIGFLPLYIIMLIGFILCFSIQNENVVKDIPSILTAIVKTSAMVVGELGVENLELQSSGLKQIMFFIFMSLMCIIMLNLLIGVSIGEINNAIDEADTKLISMKIKLTLSIQETFTKTFKKYGASDQIFIYDPDTSDYEFYTKLKKLFDKLFMIENRKDYSKISMESQYAQSSALFEKRLKRIENVLEDLSRQITLMREEKNQNNYEILRY